MVVIAIVNREFRLGVSLTFFFFWCLAVLAIYYFAFIFTAIGIKAINSRWQ